MVKVSEVGNPHGYGEGARQALEDGWAVAAAGHLAPTDNSAEAQEIRDRAAEVSQRETEHQRDAEPELGW